VDIPDVGRAMFFKAQFCVKFKLGVVHGWWWEDERGEALKATAL
jgi:hypothetical protein